MKKNILFLILVTLNLDTSLMAQSSSPINLGNIATEANPVRLISVGSSLSAGVRDGGVNAASQETSFPALLAKQMGITDFKQPLLPNQGTGSVKVTVNKFGVMKFQKIIGLDDLSKGANLPKVTNEVDNLSIPYQKVFDIYESDEDVINPLFDNRSFRHLKRFASKDNSTIPYLEVLKTKSGKIDFFTFEFGFHDFIQFIEAGGYATDITYIDDRESVGEEKLLRFLKENTSKGVILNVPDPLKFPVYKKYTLSKLIASTDQPQIYIEHWQKTHVREAQQGDIFLPKKSIVDLLEKRFIGTSIQNPLKDEDVLDVEEQRFARPLAYNILLNKFAEKHKLPVVDIYKLYNQILEGEYVSEEGVSIDPSFPGGNFFSQDGITPTALGQAIITNEIIKVINDNYSSNIPLLGLKKFL